MSIKDFPVLPAATAHTRPIYWEPMPGCGERLTVAVAVDHASTPHIVRVLRDDVLPALFGKPGRKMNAHLDTLLDMARLGALPNSLTLGESLNIQAETPQVAVAAAIRRFASLSTLDGVEAIEADDTPTPEAQVQYWSTQMAGWLADNRPDLTPYLNRPARFFTDGEPVKFGFLSDRACAHFGVMRPSNQAASVKDARARLYELAKARELAKIQNAGLIIATPRKDDPVLTARQHDATRRNMAELTREAGADGIVVHPAYTLDDGGRALLTLI